MSSYKNALRLVRTEMSRAYSEGIYRYGALREWIVGYRSRIASSDPGEVDLANNGKFFPKDNPPPIPYHPNCVCYAEIVIKGMEKDEDEREVPASVEPLTAEDGVKIT